VIDWTPELKAEALQILSQYRTGPVYLPAMVRGTGGKIASLILPNHTGGANWPSAAFDPETGMLYVSSITNPDVLGLIKADPKRSDEGYVMGGGRGPSTRPGASGGSAESGTFAGEGDYSSGEEPIRPNLGPHGLPLIKPPWGRITAINLNTGDQAWMIPNGDTPEQIKNNPALKGIDIGKTGEPERSQMLVTKTLLFGSDGAGLFNAGPYGGGKTFRAIDKKTGAIIFEMKLPANTTGCPMTYMMNDRQYIVVATGGRGIPAELIALALP
jgi:quinoprotein glucose dehydrogenase